MFFVCCCLILLDALLFVNATASFSFLYTGFILIKALIQYGNLHGSSMVNTLIAMYEVVL